MVAHKYTEDEHKFLRQFVPGHTYKEITEAFNKKFDTNIAQSQIKSYIHNHKLNTGKTGRFEKGHITANKGTHPPTVGRMGETQYKKGNLPHNTKPVGYERITKDGYIEVKIKMRPSHPNCNDNFKAKHHIVWEEVNGPIPSGYKLTFLDGNKQNCDISNLALITNAEHLEITRKGLRTDDARLTETGVLIARASVLIREKKKGR